MFQVNPPKLISRGDKAMQANTITFDSSAKLAVLDLFDAAVDEDGYLVEKGNPTQKILSPDGVEIPLGKFGGVQAGSIQFLRSDLPSLIALYDRLQSQYALP